MKFYIPNAKDKEQEQEVYEGIRKFLSQEMGAKFSDRKIFSLQYGHKGKKESAEVGKTSSVNGEKVIAILYEPSRNLYHVCTSNRGVARGTSILVGYFEVEEVTDFEKELPQPEAGGMQP
jgi:hypothetical protein